MIQKKSPLGELRELAEGINLSPRHTRDKVFGTLLVLTVLAAVYLAGWAGWLERPENLYYGLWHHLAGERYQPEHVVIVSMDDETLAEHPDEPMVCLTPVFAQALERLRLLEARIIGLDYLYLVSIESWLQRFDFPGGDFSRTFDIPFRRQLGSGEAILAAKLSTSEDGKRLITLPIPDYYYSLPRPPYHVGLVDLFPDPDNVIRRFVPALASDAPESADTLHGFDNTGADVWFTFAKLLALRFAGGEPGPELQRLKENPAVPAWNVRDWAAVDLEALPLIGFVGPPGTFPRISMRHLAADDRIALGKVQPEGLQEAITVDAGCLAAQVAGKVVIVAFEPSFMQDVHHTPYSQSFYTSLDTSMPGPEIHANTIETLLTGKAPRPVDRTLTWVYLTLGLVLATVLFFRLSTWSGLAAGVVLCLAAGGVSYALFLARWILPATPVQAAILLAYVGVLMIHLTGEKRDRAHLRQMFGRYVADEVVERLLASGKRPDLGGEAMTVSVLFSDIRDFTSISEKLNPRQVVEMLNAYFTRACEPILDQGGTVDKFIGDAVMAVFGSPVPYPDHARRAVTAALALARMAKEFQAWMTEHFGHLDLPIFRIGIGLHTGEAVVGNIGSPRRLEFTSIGDTVNIASRLESRTKELGWTIVASRDIIRAAGEGVVTGRADTLELKGKKMRVEVVEVLGEAGD